MRLRRLGVLLGALGLAAFCALLRQGDSAGAGNRPPSGTPASCPRPSGGQTGLSTPPTGLIAFDIYAPKQGTAPFEADLFAQDSPVGGVDLAIQWQTLEPDVKGPWQVGEPTPIHWAVLDCLFDEANANHKFVVLTLTPGFSTPSWALAGVPTFPSSFAYHASVKPPRRLPLPWDQTYLDRWFAFLRAVSARYGSNPEFRMISASGPSSVSSEMTLPNLPGSPDCSANETVCDAGLPADYTTPAGVSEPLDGSDITMWTDLGYTPTELIEAWKSVFAAYRQIFPNQYMSLALFPGLPIPDVSEKTATPLAVIAAGLTYDPAFVLQENGLKTTSSTTPASVYADVQADACDAVTGLQTTVPHYIGTPFDAALQRGVDAGVDFLEIYVGDLTKNNHAALEHAAHELPAKSACGHTKPKLQPPCKGTTSAAR